MAFYKRLTIGVQLYTIAIVTGIVIFLVVFYTYSKLSEVVQLHNAKSYENLIHQISESQQHDFDTISGLITNVAFNNVVQNFVTETDPLKKYDIYQQLKIYLMSNMLSANDGIMDIAIMSNSNSKINLFGILDDEMVERVDQLVSHQPKKKVYYSNLMKYMGNDSFMAVSVIYQTANAQQFGTEIGKVVFIVKAQNMAGGVNATASMDAPKIYMVDRNFKLFASNQNDVPAGTTFEFISPDVLKQHTNERVKVKNELYTVSATDIPEVAGHIISMVPHKNLARDLANIRVLEIIIFLSAIGLLSIPFSIVIGNILKSLKTLLQFMNQFKKGDLNKLKQNITLDGFSEIRVVASHFNTMLSEIDHLMGELVDSNTKVLRMELDKKHAEYEALKSQMNPHFMYNTLETIRGLAAEYGADNIREIVTSMGRILRYSIKGNDRVRLQEELQVVESYCGIQSFRFRNRFEFNFDISQETLDAEIPKMVMQPLIENALYHGLEPKRGTGSIVVRTKIEDSMLILEIEDDGVGITSDTMANIQYMLSDDRNEDDMNAVVRQSIGIVNVHRRIQLKYGNCFGLEIQSREQVGTNIVMKLPYRRMHYV
ncbi:sensor histidine kinase [Paenibacillus sp. FSL R10-2734]|uniref:sensor histidine kinase n=1 Tax=Paenibacillus sp. FSL R10-2734 TaxID=2954691 RepID=UPI0030D98C96